jgi:hypothetical protein
MGEALALKLVASRITLSTLKASLLMDSSEASTRAGLTSALGGKDSVDSVGFEWDWGAATTGAFGEMDAELALGLGLIK